jgi:O-antigen/teichoic acid export membrane protein
MAGILNYMANQSYIWVGGRALSKEQMGFFSMALELAQLPLAKVMAVINQLLYPEIAKRRREGMKDATSALGGYRILFILLYPLFTGMAVTAPTWIPLILGDKWIAGISALQWFCLCMVLQAVCSVHATIISGMGAVRKGLVNAGLYCAVSFLLVVAATWFGEAWALAAAAVLAVAINLFVMVSNTRDVCGFGLRDIVHRALPGLSASAVMGITVWFAQFTFSTNGWPDRNLKLCLLIAIGATLYISLLRWMWGIKVFDEIRRLRKI